MKKDFIGIYLLNGYVYLEAIDYKGNAYQLIKTNYKLDLTKWNFIGLNYINRCDGPGYILKICLVSFIIGNVSADPHFGYLYVTLTSLNFLVLKN